MNSEEALAEIASGVRLLARSITPDALPGTDASGGHVESLTESVMGINKGLLDVSLTLADGLHEVADSMRAIATAIEERGEG